MKSSRRKFIKTASVIAAGTVFPLEALTDSGRSVSATDKIQVGLIGANGMGFSDLESFLKNPEIECVAMCDIDRNVLNRRTDDLVKMNRARPKLYI
ncbi:MAG: oxidoreductase, partial [Odoribacter sp.]|nr:oxidoreductase [Odoribacter sp.]